MKICYGPAETAGNWDTTILTSQLNKQLARISLIMAHQLPTIHQHPRATIDLSTDNLACKQTKRAVKWSIPWPEACGKLEPWLALILLTARQLITRHNKFNNFGTGSTWACCWYWQHQHFATINILINLSRSGPMADLELGLGWLLKCVRFGPSLWLLNAFSIHTWHPALAACHLAVLAVPIIDICLQRKVANNVS